MRLQTPMHAMRVHRRSTRAEIAHLLPLSRTLVMSWIANGAHAPALLCSMALTLCPARSTAADPTAAPASDQATTPSLRVAVNGDSVAVRLILPDPHRKASTAAAEPHTRRPGLAAALRIGDGYFELPREAGCHIDGATVRMDADQGLAIAEYDFCCDGVAAGAAPDVSRISFTGFEALGIEALDAEASQGARQLRKRLTADDNELRFRADSESP